jgi:hypothetical protein
MVLKFEASWSDAVAKERLGVALHMAYAACINSDTSESEQKAFNFKYFQKKNLHICMYLFFFILPSCRTWIST